jgi:phosphoribosylformylglycinamidine cyclo-ligase
LKIKIDWNCWEVPAIFKLIQESGEISDEEMREVFNMGIGLVFVVSKENVDTIFNLVYELNEKAILIGEVE